MVYDTRRSAIVRFGPEGNPRGEMPVQVMNFPLALEGDSLYSIDQTSVLRGLPARLTVQEIGVGANEPQTILDNQEPLFARTMQDTPGARPPLPAFAVRHGLMAIGDPNSGEIALLQGRKRSVIRIPGAAPRRGPIAATALKQSLQEQLNSKRPEWCSPPPRPRTRGTARHTRP